MVNGGVGSRSSRGHTARLNNGRAALADSWQESVGIPDLVVDQVFDRLAIDGGETVVRVHCGRMVAPHSEFFNVSHAGAGFGGDLAQRAVVVQAQHGGEVFAWQVWRALHGDVGIGVGGVANDQHLDVAAGNRVKRFALSNKNCPIDSQQLGTLHARATRTGTDQQRVVGVFERHHRVAVRFHANQQREGAIVEFHHDTLEGFLRAFNRDFEQLQNHRLVCAEHFARGNAEQQGITDLASCPSDCNTDGFFAHDRELSGWLRIWLRRSIKNGYVKCGF